MSVNAATSDGYLAATEQVAVLDSSEQGKLALTGTEAKQFLNGVITNDAEPLTPGHGLYAAFLTPKGKMRGDLRVFDSGSELLLSTERVALQTLFDTLRGSLVGYDAELHKRTLQMCQLTLVGPHSLALVGTAALDVEHDNAQVTIDGIDALAVRTDTGVELFAASEHQQDLFSALASRGAAPIDQTVAECVRIERGRPRYGAELDDTTIPQEADLNDRAVNFTKGCYVGQETVARLFYKGKPNRHLRGLRSELQLPEGSEIRSGKKSVGTVGSSTVSPTRGPLALALIRREAEPGSQVLVGPEAITAEVVELPWH